MGKGSEQLNSRGNTHQIHLYCGKIHTGMKLHSYHPTVTTIVSLISQHNMWHETFEHKPVKTSEEAAAIRTGYSLEQGAKALLIRVKKSATHKFFVMVVLAGDKKFDSKKLTSLLGAKNIRFATVDEVTQITNGIQIGGVPPFGNIFSIPTYLDTSVTSHEKIIFNAGDRSFSIALKTQDYLQLNPPEEIITVTNGTTK